jgi:curved DNA-binding protein
MATVIFKDYYRILGFESSRVTEEEIKKAHREQVKKYHPDVNNVSNDERMQDINEAYNTLMDPIKRKKYDKKWRNTIGRKRGKNANSVSAELLNIFLGKEDESVNKTKKTKGNPVKGENINSEIEINVEDGFYGSEKNIELRTLSGKTKNIKVVIPKGIQENEKLKIKSQGKEGKNGGENGDLVLRVKFKQKEDLTIQGLNIKKVVKITPWEALLGGKISFNYINEEISLIVPKGTKNGDVELFENKGYIDKLGNRGSLEISYLIVNPEKPTEDEIKLYEELKLKSSYNPR